MASPSTLLLPVVVVMVVVAGTSSAYPSHFSHQPQYAFLHEQPASNEHLGYDNNDEDDFDWSEVEDDDHHRGKRQTYRPIDYHLPTIPP